MDGWVIIGTKMDTKQLEKDLKSAEKRLSDYEKEAEKLATAKSKAEVDLQPYEEQRRKLKEIQSEYVRLQQESDKVDTSTKEGIANYRAIQTQIARIFNEEAGLTRAVEENNGEYEKTKSKLSEINQKIQENAKNQGLVKQEIQETKQKINQAKGFDIMKDNINDIKKSMKDTLKSVARWALAIVGIRSLYNGIRSAVSLVSSKNEEIANQFDVMKNAIANALLPVVQQIVNWLVKIMIYINYIVRALTGKNLFDFDKAFEDAKNNANKTEKSVKSIKKQLAGFDEMNVLSDTATSGSSGGGGIDTSKLTNPFEGWEDVEIPGWVDKIAEFGKWVIDNWEQVVGLLLLTKLVIDLFTGNWVGVIFDILGFVILAIPQIIQAIKDIWDVLTDIGAWLIGVFVDAVKGIITTISLEIAKFIVTITNIWEIVKKVFGYIKDFVVSVFNGIVSLASKTINSIIDFFKKLPGNIKTIFTNIVNSIKNVFKTIVDWMDKHIVQPISNLFEGMVNGLENIFTGIKNTIIGIVNVFIKAINGIIKGLNKISVDVPDWVPGFGGQKWGFNLKEIKEIKLAKGGIINNPGRGVPLASNVVGGEVSREGVIPLTDSQMMEQLGATIGKYITINASIINTMNGRVISRELKKIQNADDFAFNG